MKQFSQIKTLNFKFLYRLSNSDRNFEFFRSNTLDFVSFGFNKLRQGCNIGLPLSYFATDKRDIFELTSKNGFQNFLGHSITLRDLMQKLDQDQLDKFYNSLLLSNEAKQFGLAREIGHTNHFIKSVTENIVDFVCLSGAYVYSYSITRARKLQILQRRKIYLGSGLFALAFMISSRLFTKKLIDKTDDLEACQMGLDCSEGSIEFYDKLMCRNKILRQLLPNGDTLIDSEGNYLKEAMKIPFLTDYYIYKNFTGLKLTERKENCKQHLAELVFKLTKENEENELKRFREQDGQAEAKSEDKELRIFKYLRLKLEDLIHSK